MEENNTPNIENVETEEKKEGFFTKLKNGLAKFFKGVKNFIIKTKRVNSKNCYGIIDRIGDLLVYDDHALISAVGMDDVVFKKENVLASGFIGLGRIRRNKATVKYSITLDDNVVFPPKVREKNDVNNLEAIIFIEKEKDRLFALGTMEHGTPHNGLYPIEDCEVYDYGDCFVIVVKLQRQNGDKVEKYEESLLYPVGDITEILDSHSGGYIITFDDGKTLTLNHVKDFGKAKIEKIKNDLK